MSHLTFADLRWANRARIPLFKNSRGEPAHSMPNGADWRPAQWNNAATGEFGELLIELGNYLQLANTIKKFERGDLKGDLEAARKRVANELADCVIYLDLLALQFDVNLGTAVKEKFNEVSLRVGCDVTL